MSPVDEKIMSREEESRVLDLLDWAVQAMLRDEDPSELVGDQCLGKYQAFYDEMYQAGEEGVEAARTVLTKYIHTNPEIAALRAADPAIRKSSWYAAELYATDFPEPRYLVPGLLPAGLVALGARPKIGKSWMGLQISVAVGTGGQIFDQAVSRGRVLYLALEDSPRRMKNRLQKQQAPGDADIRFEFAWPSLVNDGMADLIREIERWRYSLIVIDTLARALGFIDPNKQAEMTMHLGLLQRIAVDRNMTILLIDHHRKSNGVNSDAVDDLLGATAKAGVLDVAMGLYRERGEKNATLKVTGRDIEERELAVLFDRDTGCWQSLGDAEEAVSGRQQIAVLDAIRTLGAPSHREITDVTGQDRSHCFQRIQELVHKGKIRQIEGYPARYTLIVSDI